MNNEIVLFKIYLPQSSIQLRMTQKKASELASSLRSKSSWIDLPISKLQSLHLKSENIMGYEFSAQSVIANARNGLMNLTTLADTFGMHHVSVSRLISEGKIPAISSGGKKRKHSKANLETALALRDHLISQNREAPTEAEIKKLFSA